MASGERSGRACVTGASSGIGRAFAERLAADGMDLALVARRADRLEELAVRLRAVHGVDVAVWPADLTQPDELRAVAERLAAADDLAMLVNNAGASTFGRFHELDVDAEEELLALLVTPVVRLTHAALGGMVARGRGAVVQVSSRAALRPNGGLATYSGAKAFVNAFTEALAGDLAGSGVRFLSVCPGLTRTELFERAGIDVSAVDPRSWTEPERVADEALRDLGRGELVCVPGAAGRGEWIRRFVPAPWLRRAAGVLRRLARV